VTSSKFADFDDNYWRHDEPHTRWDRNCRIEHDQPTWYYSHMGRKERVIEWQEARRVEKAKKAKKAKEEKKAMERKKASGEEKALEEKKAMAEPKAEDGHEADEKSGEVEKTMGDLAR